MATLKVPVLLLVLVAQCWTAPLEVLVDGVEFTGTGFCVGDNVIFICDILSNGHVWNVAGSQLSIGRAVTMSHIGGPDNRFSVAVARPLPNDSIITTLSVTAYSGFDAVSITCADGNGVFPESQTSTATILGPPSAPDVRPFAGGDFQSFIVSLTTAGSSARCVIQYSLTIAENGEPLTTMTIGSSGITIAKDLNLCKNMYTFTAVAMTMGVNSSSSDPVAGTMNFSAVSELSAVRVNNGVVQWTISSCLPGECYGSYSLQLSQCTIQDLTILPALNLSDDAVREIYTGISAARPPTSMTAVNSASYESVDIDNCVRPNLRTSITPASISGHLVLFSASNEASTSICNISLSSEGVASTSSLVTSCSATEPVSIIAVITTIAATGGSDGGGGDGGDGSSGAVIGGVVGGIGVAVLLILVVIVIVVVVLFIKKGNVCARK